jgi:hypothetical protein
MAAPATAATSDGSAGITSTNPTAAAAWQNMRTFALRDACGGVNGHVNWTGSSIQSYGTVWENTAPGCRGGQQSVWLSWHTAIASYNIEMKAVNPGPGQGFNYSHNNAPWNDAGIRVTLCSSVGGWHCPAHQNF